MKLVSFSTSDKNGGAAIGAFRLFKGFLKKGINGKMIVAEKITDDKNVEYAFKSPIGSARRRRWLDCLPLKLYKRKEKVLFSSAIVPEKINKRIEMIYPDIIHLNWICNGFIQIESLRKFKKPILWTLRDMWPFTGGCHYDNQCRRYEKICGSCPILGSNREYDLSRLNLRRKIKSWREINLTAVTPSKWLAECVKSSSILKEKRVEVIANGIDTDIFKPIEKSFARNLLNLPQEQKIIAFGALNSTHDRRKGFHFLKEALMILRGSMDLSGIELLIIGASQPEPAIEFGFNANYLGTLKDEISLVLAYNAADIFIAPSLQDNLPHTVMESLACGIPVVAFNIGGMPDMIDHLKNGFLVKPFELEELAYGMEWMLTDKVRLKKLSENSRQKVKDGFSLKSQVMKYIDLCKDIAQ